MSCQFLKLKLRSKVQPYKDINKDGKLTRWEIAKFVHDELAKQGETVKMSQEEEQEMISEILKVEGIFANIFTLYWFI